jgi:hypothetical protein
MTTGNAAASTVSVAAVAPGGPPPSCADLDKKNKEERQKVSDDLKDGSDLSKEEQTTLNKAESTGMTVSSAHSTVPGAEGLFTGCSSGHAQTCNPNGMVGGGTSEQKCGLNAETRASSDPKHDDAKDKAGVLCDKSHVHPGGGKGAHAEAKIVNHMSNIPGGAMKGGSLTVSIDWRFKTKAGPKQSGMPCSACYAMLCKAASECDIQIFICDKDNNPQPLSKENCADEDGYDNLCQRVDGNATPGR